MKNISEQITTVTDKAVSLKISEHDAYRLLNLVRKEAHKCDKIWQPYWERLIQVIEKSMEPDEPNSSLLKHKNGKEYRL